MRKLTLPDGWHRLPGDGLGLDPDRRMYYASHIKYHWLAKIKDGVVIALGGTSDRNEIRPSDIGREDRIKSEDFWGISVEDLLEPQVDEWADDFILKVPIDDERANDLL